MAAPGLSCGMWGLVPRPGFRPEPPALGMWSLNRWIIRQVPEILFSASRDVLSRRNQEAFSLKTLPGITVLSLSD